MNRNDMTITHKLIIFGILTAFASILTVVGYNTYETATKVSAYRECVTTTERITTNLVAHNVDIRYSSLPSCTMR